MRRTGTWCASARARWLAAMAVGTCACADPSTPNEGGAPAAPAEAGLPAKAAVSVEEFPFAPGYVGSDACASCHEPEYKAWRDSLHSRMEQQAAPSTVIGDFTVEGTVVPLGEDGRRLAMYKEGDRFFVEAPDRDGKQARYAVDRTVGNRYKQRYLAKFADGSWHPLPVQWNQKDGKFIEWAPNPAAQHKASSYWTEDAWQWQLKCAGCHATGLSLGFDPATKTYDTKWRELAIGCESCHGPGAVHARAGGGVENILCPSRMTQTQQLDICGKCHSRGSAGPAQGAPEGLPAKISYPYDMLPGEKLDGRFVQETREANAPNFHGDGSSLNHHQQLTDYRKSDMLHKGGEKAPNCTTCHEPHAAAALKKPVENNALCLQCHKEFRSPELLSTHTGHGSDPKANAGAKCVECHMPRIVAHAGSDKLRSHTYWAPSPRRSKDTGTPDACLLCHKDKDAAWSESEAERIWPGLGAKAAK